jgi:mannose-6-phosphate isomerase-like protein (cupin superfamily)
MKPLTKRGDIMITRKWKDIEPRENIHKVDVRDLYSDETAQVVHILLKPGEELKPHLTPVDVAFYVLEGIGTVLIGDEKQEIKAGTLVESPQMIAHCWYNKGNNDLRVLVIKAPKPKSKAIIL